MTSIKGDHVDWYLQMQGTLSTHASGDQTMVTLVSSLNAL